MVLPSDRRILFLIKALIALLFISKISLGVLLPIPSSFWVIIFQKGLHPFLNIVFVLIFGGPLIFLFLRVRGRRSLSPFYKIFVILLTLVLAVQTILQIQFGTDEASSFLQLASLLMTFMLILVYGVVIPSLWSAKQFLFFVQKWTGVLVVISMILLVTQSPELYRGTRFVGIFKHIPYMVSCATLAFIFSLGTFVMQKSLLSKFWNTVVLFLSFAAIVLTGTRSSAGAALVAAVLTLILQGASTNSGRVLKFLLATFILTSALLFGGKAFDLASNIATGKSSLGGRQAQDGLASRWDEVERGTEIFYEHPFLGHGLLSKFGHAKDTEDLNYNSMKDPHNIFVSAGVIGGWPLLVLSVIAVLFAVIGGLKAFRSADPGKRQIAIYLVTHIPILVIYHVHLSVGGLADRMYWMVFGFIAASTIFLDSELPGSDQNIDSSSEVIS